MSRTGKAPIETPKGVDIQIAAGMLTVKGPKGSLNLTLSDDVSVEQKDGTVTVKPRDAENAQSRAMWGTTRANIQNMVLGVTMASNAIWR